MQFDEKTYTFQIEVADVGNTKTLLTRSKYAPKNLIFNFESHVWDGETRVEDTNRITTTMAKPIVTTSGDYLVWR